MKISFSRYLAIVFGILTPLAETIRRWSTWRENPPALFDDYILGLSYSTGPGASGETLAAVNAFWRQHGPSCAAWLTVVFSNSSTGTTWASAIRRLFRLVGWR